MHDVARNFAAYGWIRVCCRMSRSLNVFSVILCMLYAMQTAQRETVVGVACSVPSVSGAGELDDATWASDSSRATCSQI